MGKKLMVKVNFTTTVEVDCQEVYVNIIERRLEYNGRCFEYVGAGASRKVFRYGNIVFKLAKNEFGLRQNRAEVDLYTGINKDLEDLICPILWFSDDFKVLICAYAEPLYRANGWREDTIDSIKQDEYKQTVHYDMLEGKLLDLKNRHRLDTHDLLKISSWGMLEGRAVLVDYGYNNEVAWSCDFSVEYEQSVLRV
jgi:hypothetical protein